MTGLYNRDFLQRMREEGVYDHLDSCGVLYFDVNNLKKLNDTLGHEEGDAHIILVADSLKAAGTRNTHVYRMGGDEFMMVMLNCSQDEINIQINHWRWELHRLCTERNRQCNASVGKAFGVKGYDFDELVRIADAEMYENKRLAKIGRTQ